MNSDPRVSIIIPTYGRPRELSRSIESVLNQTYKDFELIIINDGSGTDIRTIVSEYTDPRVRYFEHESNKGGAAARNTGILKSQGELVAFLDDDDEWMEKKLEKQIQCLESKDSDWVGVYCDLEFVRESYLKKFFDRFSSRFSGKEGGEELIEFVLKRTDGIPGTASNLVIKTKIAKEISGFDENFERLQDWEFIIRVLMKGKLACVEEKLVKKYDTGHISANHLEQNEIKFANKFSVTIHQNSDQVDFEGIQNFTLAKAYYREGNFSKGTEYLKGASMYSNRQRAALIWAIFSGIKK
jgi:glycosyltransferase involved in cell wall biosynthesis